MGTDLQLDAVADVRVACAADGDDAAILDTDIGFDDAYDWVDDDGTDDDGVQLTRAGVFRLRLAKANGLAVAPQRLVSVSLPVILDAQPEVRVCDANPVADGWSVAGVKLVAIQCSALRARTSRGS